MGRWAAAHSTTCDVHASFVLGHSTVAGGGMLPTCRVILTWQTRVVCVLIAFAFPQGSLRLSGRGNIEERHKPALEVAHGKRFIGEKGQAADHAVIGACNEERRA